MTIDDLFCVVLSLGPEIFHILELNAERQMGRGMFAKIRTIRAREDLFGVPLAVANGKIPFCGANGSKVHVEHLL